MNTPELVELLLNTDLDTVQVAHLTGLPLPMVAGCNDVLHGTTDGCRTLHDPAELRLYVAGQRLADEWFYAGLEATDATPETAA